MIKFSNHLRKTYSTENQNKIKEVLLNVGKFQSEVESILKPYSEVVDCLNVRKRLEKIFLNFHSVAIELKHRQRKREPLLINDEYDFQYLLHGLLKIDFTNIRPEDCCPSYGYISPRIDFFLKNEQIAIETKVTRKGHGHKEIQNELIIDKEYYQKKPGVNLLYCVVYDPSGIITDHQRFEEDLNEKSMNFEVIVMVIPKHRS